MVSGHRVIKAAKRGHAFVGAMLDPVNGQADRRAADHGQVQDRDGITDSAAIFVSGDVESEMQAVFDSPVTAVGRSYLAQREPGKRSGGQEPFRFDFLGFDRLAIDEASQPGGLRDAGEARLLGAHVEAMEAPRLQTAAIAFDVLERVDFSPRGKRRAASLCALAARYRQPRVGCP